MALARPEVKIIVMFPRWGPGGLLLVVLGWACLLALVSCTSYSELPTRAVSANLRLAQPTRPVAIADAVGLNAAKPNTAELAAEEHSSEVPATFTPMPLETLVQNVVTYEALPPTFTPTPTPPFPSPTPTSTSTPLPTATATRYVRTVLDLPPTDDLGPSKMGMHVVRNNDPDIMEFVRKAQPAVMKAVDDLGFLAEVKEASPRTITVGRINIDHQSYDGSPEEAAQLFVEKHLEKYRLNPAVDYWEGWNEPDPNLNNMIWFSRFEQERVKLMAQHGFRCAIGGFPTGVPELDEFQLFLPAIDAAMKHGGVLSLHEYSAPDMAWLYGDPLPGYPSYPDRGSLTFRYRWFYREILEPGGMVIPLIITEAGVDGIIGNRPGPEGKGWRDFGNYWVQQGIGKTDVEAFINQLAWYDAGARQDGYVIGFTVFTAGGFGYWENYNVNQILPQLADYVVSQR